jgi:hypothetical protein
MRPLRGFIEVSERGTWVADLVFPEASTGVFETGTGETWTGTVLSQVDDTSSWHATIVGGKGGLSKVLKDRWYQGGGTGNTIAKDILTEAGEVAGEMSLPVRAPQYFRQTGKAGEQLDNICDLLKGNWWIDRAGLLFCASARPATVIDTKERVQISEDTNSVVLSTEVTAGIEPGCTWNGKLIRHVRWVLSDKTYAELSYLPLFVARDQRQGLDYSTTHKAVVKSQSAVNGKLTVTVDGRYTLTEVPWLGGVPAKVTLESGDLVSVGFWNRDGRQPYAFSINQLSSGAPSARVQDAVEGGTILIGQNAATFVVAAVYVPPTPWPTPDDAGKAIAQGLHAVAVAAATAALSSAATPVVATLALSGLIASGDERIKH